MWFPSPFDVYIHHAEPINARQDRCTADNSADITSLEMMRETWGLHDESLFTQRTFAFHTSQRIILACSSLSDWWSKTIYQSDMCATWFCSFAKIIKRMMLSSTQNDVCVRSHVVFYVVKNGFFCAKIFVCWRRERILAQRYQHKYGRESNDAAFVRWLFEWK